VLLSVLPEEEVLEFEEDISGVAKEGAGKLPTHKIAPAV